MDSRGLFVSGVAILILLLDVVMRGEHKLLKVVHLLKRIEADFDLVLLD